MKVFKFGGASVKNAAAISNVVNIIRSFRSDKLLVVVSAMGNTTDALEEIFEDMQSGRGYSARLAAVKQYHSEIAEVLLPGTDIVSRIGEQFSKLESELQKDLPPKTKYDQVVCFGEIISSQILFQYAQAQGIRACLLDARDYVATDDHFGEAKIDWPRTQGNMQQIPTLFETHDVLITQGFIGKAPNGLTTTLGREGSDFTAAIFASCLKAESLTVWKDVPGLMNADPKRLADAVVLKELPYSEAAEMMYYGANLIHTKTIRPLATKKIPLIVKSFIDPSLPGSKIHDSHIDELPTMFVFKDNQCLVSCKVTDYAFISELQLREIFALLNALSVRFNMVQHSAISFSFCFDYDAEKLENLLKGMRQTFEVYYNLNLTLITIKNYTPEVFALYRNRSGILLEQSSRSTLQILVKT
jgi:aspartate kinase